MPRGKSFKKGTDAAKGTINVGFDGRGASCKRCYNRSTFVQKQKKDQEVTVSSSEQRGPSEKKPDAGRSGHAEELKEKVKDEKSCDAETARYF